MISAIVSHNVFLTEAQRYELISNGELQGIIGVSVPVWIYRANAFRGSTSEPAEEVFARYHFKVADSSKIELKEGDYHVSLRTGELLPDQKYSMNVDHLKNISDGGSEYLRFRSHYTIVVDNESATVTHVVELNDMKVLEDTLFS